MRPKRGESLKTGRACAMAEALGRACDHRRTGEEAEGEPKSPCGRTMRSNVPRTKVPAGTLGENRDGVPACFDDGLANGIPEGVNSAIRSAKRAARGFRNFEYFSTMIYLKLGKLPLVEQICATH